MNVIRFLIVISCVLLFSCSPTATSINSKLLVGMKYKDAIQVLKKYNSKDISSSTSLLSKAKRGEVADFSIWQLSDGRYMGVFANGPEETDILVNRIWIYAKFEDIKDRNSPVVDVKEFDFLASSVGVQSPAAPVDKAK